MGILKSKTMWFNLLFIITVIANGFGFQEFEPGEQSQSIANGIVLLLGGGIGNMILRFFTKKPVLEKRSLLE